MVPDPQVDVFPLRVGIVEADPGSRNWMNLVIERDWRTLPVGASGRLSDLFQAQPAAPLDLLLFSLDEPFSAQDQAWIDRAWRQNCSMKVILVSNQPDPAVLPLLANPWVGGWLIKNEIGYSLAWACYLAAEGFWVATAGAVWAILDGGLSLPAAHLQLDGRWLPGDSSLWELESTRRALLFRQVKVHPGSPAWKALERSDIAPCLDHPETLTNWYQSYPPPLSSAGRLLMELWRRVCRSEPDSALDLAFHLVTTPAVSPPVG